MGAMLLSCCVATVPWHKQLSAGVGFETLHLLRARVCSISPTYPLAWGVLQQHGGTDHAAQLDGELGMPAPSNGPGAAACNPWLSCSELLMVGTTLQSSGEQRPFLRSEEVICTLLQTNPAPAPRLAALLPARQV